MNEAITENTEHVEQLARHLKNPGDFAASNNARLAHRLSTNSGKNTNIIDNVVVIEVAPRG